MSTRESTSVCIKCIIAYGISYSYTKMHTIVILRKGFSCGRRAFVRGGSTQWNVGDGHTSATDRGTKDDRVCVCLRCFVACASRCACSIGFILRRRVIVMACTQLYRVHFFCVCVWLELRSGRKNSNNKKTNTNMSYRKHVATETVTDHQHERERYVYVPKRGRRVCSFVSLTDGFDNE